MYCTKAHRNNVCFPLTNVAYANFGCSHISDVFDQEMGVPQGSILSVTLFALKINSIVKSVSPVSNALITWTTCTSSSRMKIQ